MKSGLPSVVLAYVGGALLGVSALHVFDNNPTWIWLVMMSFACGIYAVRLFPAPDEPISVAPCGFFTGPANAPRCRRCGHSWRGHYGDAAPERKPRRAS